MIDKTKSRSLQIGFNIVLVKVFTQRLPEVLKIQGPAQGSKGY